MAVPILCPSCRKLITSDEPRCPYCGLSRPGARWSRSLYGLLRLDADTLLTNILYLNVGLYVLSLALAPSRALLSPSPFSFLSPADGSLLLLGASGTIPVVGLGRWWTVVSANYLHGSVLHIVFNMIALRQIGPLIVREYGAHRAAALYTLGGVAGFVVSVLAGVRFTIGASAAVCALIGGALYYGKSRGGAYGQAVYQSVWGWAVSIFLFGFLVPGINNWAHGGGMAAGFLLGQALGYEDAGRERPWHRQLGTVCAGVTLAVVAWAVVTGVGHRLAG